MLTCLGIRLLLFTASRIVTKRMHTSSWFQQAWLCMQNVSGRMPVMVFVNAFLAGAPRAAVRCNAGIMRGPLSPQKQHKQELAGNVKIMYPHCKHGVFAPTDWDPSQLEHSAALPDKSMELDFVHGYEGKSTLSSNVHYSAGGRIVYHIAAVGIVYCRSTHRQEFFIGHNDDILCLAMHPDKLTVASGQVSQLPNACHGHMHSCLLYASFLYVVGSRLYTPDSTQPLDS